MWKIYYCYCLMLWNYPDERIDIKTDFKTETHKMHVKGNPIKESCTRVCLKAINFFLIKLTQIVNAKSFMLVNT